MYSSVILTFYMTMTMTMKLRDFKQLNFVNGVVDFDGVLFLHQEDKGQQQFEYFLGNKSLSQESIRNFNGNVERAVSLSKDVGFEYMHIVFPAKPCVYRDHFHSIGCNINSIFNLSHKHNHVIYPSFLPEHYDALDTHTNDKGIAYLLSLLSDKFNLCTLPNAIWMPKEIGGDLATMTKTGAKCKADYFLGYGSKLNTLKIQHYTIANALDGNTGHFDYMFNPYAVNKARLVLFGDSFFRTRLRMFASLFSEVVFFRNPYVMEDVVRNLNPDFVLSGNAERYLVSVPDSMTAVPWFLNYLAPRFDSKSIDLKHVEVFKKLFSKRDMSSFGMHTKNVTSDLKEMMLLRIEDIKNPIDIDFIRDIAIENEHVDIKLSFHLMKLAHEARPQGPFIKKKLAEYEKALSEQNKTN